MTHPIVSTLRNRQERPAFPALRTEQLGAPGYAALSGPAVRTQVLHMRPKYGAIIIDVSELDTAALRAARTVAEVALLPFQARTSTCGPSTRSRALITEAQQYRDALLRAVGCDNQKAGRHEPRAPVVLVIVAIVDSLRPQQELNNGVLKPVHPRCTRSIRKGGKVACSIRKWSGYFLKRHQGQAALRSKYWLEIEGILRLTLIP
jgi:hypothetical protein